MKLSAAELDSLCEYVDGRRAAGAGYDAIAEELHGYSVGAGARMTEEELDGLESLHHRWAQKKVYKERQRASGDERGGTGGVAEVPWQEAVMHTSVSAGAPGLFERAEGLRVVKYLKKALLKARWRWRTYRTVALRAGMQWRQCRGAGKLTLPDGTEREWLWGAVVVQSGEGEVEVFTECRKRKIHRPGWNGYVHPALVMERRELDGEGIDMRDISAGLAAVLHTLLGGEHSPFRNNQHLAALLGVSREAIRVRKQRIMERAGLRSGEGLAPNRAKGGREAQRRKGRGGAETAEGKAS